MLPAGRDRHHDVGEGVGLLGAFLQLVVQLAEAVKGLLLVGEHLDHLLALHHLLDIAVDSAEVFRYNGCVTAGRYD